MCIRDRGDASIGEDGHRLQTALAAEVGAVGVAVIEDIPLAVDPLQTAVVVSAVEHGLFRRLVGVDMDVGVAEDDTAVGERS